MIHVIYDVSRNHVMINGHAGSGPEGHDLVCAAVSALALTLAGNVAYMKAQEAVHDELIKLEEGNAEIKCTPYRQYKASVEKVMRSVCVGFELLATKYPENILYETRGSGIEKEQIACVQ